MDHDNEEQNQLKQTVENTRFPWNGKVYESPDFETAKNKLDIKISSGVGSINIK